MNISDDKLNQEEKDKISQLCKTFGVKEPKDQMLDTFMAEISMQEEFAEKGKKLLDKILDRIWEGEK